MTSILFDRVGNLEFHRRNMFLPLRVNEVDSGGGIISNISSGSIISDAALGDRTCDDPPPDEHFLMMEFFKYVSENGII